MPIERSILRVKSTRNRESNEIRAVLCIRLDSGLTVLALSRHSFRRVAGLECG